MNAPPPIKPVNKERVFAFSLRQKNLSGFLLKPILRSVTACNRAAATGSLLAALIGLIGLSGHFLPLFWGEFPSGPWGMTTPTASIFLALGLALFVETQRSVRSKALPVIVGLGASSSVFLQPWLAQRAGEEAWVKWDWLLHTTFFTETFTASGYTSVAIFIFGLCVAASHTVAKRHSKLGDILGATVLGVGMVYVLFLLGYIYGTPSFLRGNIVAPPIPSVLATVAMAVAVVSHLGPGYYPIRPLVGPSIRAGLLRKFLPVTLATVLIYSFLQESLLVFLSGAVSTFITLLMSMLIVIFLVMRSSTVLSSELEEALKESERYYTQLVSNLKDLGMSLVSRDGQILLWNQGAERLTGHRAQDVVGERLSRLLYTPDNEVDLALRRAASDGHAGILGWTDHKNGKAFWGETSIHAVRGEKGETLGFSVVLRDFTERKKADEKLQSSLQEKEVMLKEIHHRVKNNLQVISSLLRLQSEKARDTDSMSLFKDSQERVHSMAMVHEYLYQSKDLSRINFTAYVTSLVRNLSRAYGFPTTNDNLQVNVEPIFLNLDTAIPCGLLLTELVSNALKYAYPPGQAGPVGVVFRSPAEGVYELTVWDRGRGLPPDLDWESTTSLGLRLVHLLTEQLHGQIRLEKKNGTRFIIQFKKPPEQTFDRGGTVNG